MHVWVALSFYCLQFFFFYSFRRTRIKSMDDNEDRKLIKDSESIVSSLLKREQERNECIIVSGFSHRLNLSLLWAECQILKIFPPSRFVSLLTVKKNFPPKSCERARNDNLSLRTLTSVKSEAVSASDETCRKMIFREKIWTKKQNYS